MLACGGARGTIDNLRKRIAAFETRTTWLPPPTSLAAE
jgi:hypothetical protein